MTENDEMIELMAMQMGMDKDELIRERTEMSADDLEEKVESHFEELLGGKLRSMFDSRYDRGEASDMNPSTYKQREVAVEQFLEWFRDNRRDQLRESTFHRFLSDMMDEGYASDTMETRYWQLMSFVKSECNATVVNQLDAVDKNEILKNARDEESGEGQGARPIKREEYELMLDEAEGNKRMELILRCLWQMGLRASECANLRTIDFDWDDRQVTVRTAKREDHTRTLSFNLQLKNELRKWVEAERHNYAHGSNQYLFPTHKSERIYPRNLTKAVKDLAEDAGIQDKNAFHQDGAERAEITVHSFRKSFGKRRLKDPDGNLRKVQLLLGHSNTDVTEDYLDLDEEELKYTPDSVN